MNKPTLWKRIFGQKPTKKVKAQQAFQEQFDTKLRFRELEPRVVLAADATYDDMANTLNIVMNDGDTVEIGRDVDGYLVISGIDDPDKTDMNWVSSGVDTYTFTGKSLTALTIIDKGNADSADLSKLNFLDTLGTFGVGVNLTTGLLDITDVDAVSFKSGSETNIGSLEIISANNNADDMDVDIAGKLIVGGNVTIESNNDDGKGIDIDSTGSADIQMAVLTAYEKSGSGQVDINLLMGTVDLDKLQTANNSEEIDAYISDTDGVQLGEIVATNLTINAGGAITDDASSAIEVSNVAEFSGTDINLDNTSKVHDFNQLTLNATGFATVNETGGFDFVGSSFVDGKLTINTTGAIGQIAASSLVADSFADFTVGNSKDITLDLTDNEFNGRVLITGQSGRAGAVTLYDSAGFFEFGNTTVESLDVTTVGNIDQFVSIIDVSGTTTLGAVGSINLSTALGNNFAGVFDITTATKSTLTSFALQNINTTPQLGSNLEAAFADASSTLQYLFLNFSNATAWDLTETNIDGNMYVRAGGPITQSGKLVVSGFGWFDSSNGDAITLDDTMNDFMGSVKATGGAVEIVDANSIELWDITADSLIVTAGTSVGHNITQRVDGTITVDDAGSTDPTVETATFSAGGNITLDRANNFKGNVNASSTDAANGAVVINDTNALILGKISAKSLEVTAGSISQSGDEIKVTGTSDFTAAIGGDIDLSAGFASNVFGGTVSATGDGGAAGTVKIWQHGDIELGAINANKLDVLSGYGKISQTVDGVQVASIAEFRAADGEDILLNGSSMNDFGGEVGLYGGGGGTVANIALNNSGSGLLLGKVIASGNLTIETDGSITQTADGVQVGGLSKFVIGSGGSVTLDDDDNEFNQVTAKASSGTAAGVTINDKDTAANGITLGPISTLLLDITSAGAIVDTDNLISSTDARFDGASLDLTNYTGTGHAFGKVNLQIDGNAEFKELDGFSFDGTNTVGGFLDVTTGAAVGQSSGSLTVTGTTNISAGFSISLTKATNDFQDTLSLSGSMVSIVDANEIKLGNVTATKFDVQALMGKIYQEGGTALDISGTTLAKATDTYDVLFDQAGNDFTGAVSVLGFSMPSKVVLNDANDLIIGDIDSKTLTATAGKSITQLAGTSIMADTSASLDAGTTITTRDITTPMLDLTAGGKISQESGTSLIVSGMTTVEVPVGFDVDLSNTTNEFGSISVNKTLGDYAGTVTIYDSTGKLELKDIWANVLDVTVENGDISQATGTSLHAKASIALDVGGAMVLRDITAPMLDLTTGGAISQESGTSLLISGMTTIEVAAAKDVDLSETGNEFGSISVNATSMDYAGTVTIYDSGNDNADAMPNTADDGILLKDIYADMLTVTAVGTAGAIVQDTGTAIHADMDGGSSASLKADTTIMLRDVTTPMLSLTAGDKISQLSGALLVSGMTTVEIAAGKDVDLSSTTNELGSISVNATSMLEAGVVTIVDSGNDDADTTANTADDGLTLKDIYAATLNVTTTGDKGHIDQAGGTALYVSGMTMVEVDKGVDVDLSSTTNELGSISVNATSMSEAGVVTIVDSGNDDADAAADTADDGLTLKDIYAATLNVTTIGDKGDIDQAGGTALYVSGMTMVEVDKGVNVDLSSMTNELASISVNATLADYAGTVSIYDNDADLILKDIWATDLDVTAVGKLSDNSDASLVRVTGLADFSGASIALDTTTDADGHQLSNVRLVTTVGNAKLKEASGFTFDGVNSISGDLVVTSTGAILDQTDTELAVNNLTDLTGTEIDLSNTTAVLGHQTKLLTLVTTGTDPNNDAKLLELDGFTFAGKSNVLGDMLIASGGVIADQADTDLTVAGLTYLAAFAIDLDNTAAVTGHALNEVTFATTGGDADLKELDGFTFAGVNKILGDLNATSGGVISDQTDTELTVDGLTNLKATSIDLDNTTAVTGHALNKVTFVTTGGDADLKELDGFTFEGTNNIQGNLNVTTGGGITQPSGTLTVTKSTNLIVGEGTPVTLDKSNDFQGTVNIEGETLRAGDVTLFDVNSITLGDIVAKNLNVTATDAINDAADATILDVTGLTYLSGASIALDTTTDADGHQLSNVRLVTTVGNAKLKEASGFTFDGVNSISGDLVVTSTGAILDQTDTELAVNNLTDLTGTEIDLSNTTAVLGHQTKLLTLVTTGTDPNNDAKLLELDGFTFAGKSNVLGDMLIASGGVIADQADTDLTVAGLTYLAAFAIDLDNTAAVTGHALNEVTFATTGGDADLKELDGFTFEGTNDILGNLNVTTGGGITQPTGTLTVTKTTNLIVGEGDVVTLDQANDFQGSVSIVGETLRAGDVTLVDINAIDFADVVSEKLRVTAGGNITQLDDKTHLDISTQAILGLSSKATIELLNVGNDLSTDVQLDTDGNIDRIWDFEIRNENKYTGIAAADVVPGGDFKDVVKGGLVDDLTLEFVNADKLELPEIDITDDLRIIIAGDLTQAGDINVDDTAQFVGGTITLANVNNLFVSGKASFTVDKGDLEVGVVSKPIDSTDRGKDAGTDVEFGSLTFTADGQHVTISEDDEMNLVGTSVAQTLFLGSVERSIETNAGAKLTVSDLAIFDAKTDIDLGNAASSSVDLRILLAKAGGDVSIVETSNFTSKFDTETALAVMDGTDVTGTLAIQTGGHLIQVNDIRSDGTGEFITAGEALFVADGSILLTNLDVDVLAASAGNTGAVGAKSTLNITPGFELNFADAGAKGISDSSGFTTKSTLTTDVIDGDLPDENTDKYAVGGMASGFDDGAGEEYSLVLINTGDLVIDEVADPNAPMIPVPTVEGLRTYGSDAGEVFLRTTDTGKLTLGATQAESTIVGLANSGVITAIAGGVLTITPGYDLNVSAGQDPDSSPFALVSKIDQFTEVILAAPDDQFEVDDNGAMDLGPEYAREPGVVATYFLLPSVTFSPTANVVIQELGVTGEKDFRIVVDWADDSAPNPELFTFTDSFGPDVTLSHTYSSAFLFLNSVVSLEVTAMAYNSPQINLYQNVDTPAPENLNVITDRFNFFFGQIDPPLPYVPEVVRSVVPIIPQIITIEANPAPYPTLVEFADDTRVATQIDGVTVVEVDPSDFMEIGEEIELDDDFMTLDAVKEFIQNGDQFPPGLYKIEILYPGAEVPEEHFYWKQDRPDPFDLFSHSTKPIAPQAAELAAADQANAQLSAEEVWAREYDKWFPGVNDLQPADDLSAPAAEGEAGDMIPSEDDILLERVTTVSLQEIDRMTDRLRAKRSVVRDSLNGAMIGGAALMAAVAAQGRRDDEAPNHHADEQGDQPEESVDETSLGRLRRKVRHWL
ncbi:hypothetical protein [Bremerella sp. P1]|uniref:hypothetical protein n=1 Tax=Bremerella sp. P1 TaxID=3026424 RepID=UPI002368E5BF|nr:hypothetical protein [Bremerella sp. P1]WDI43637.1 hypothetical protein PSR63_06720 [Bremerella sp. P1]